MKNSNFTKMERACVLLYDEMKIQNAYDYDKKYDSTLRPAKYVQVVMARGICGNWKQPIFYDYDCKLTKDLLFEIIAKVEQIAFPVYAITSDLGGGNRGLWKELDISENKTWFLNPVNNKKVFVFADVPHLIKLLRNHYVDSGFLINNSKIQVNTKPVIELLQQTSNSDLSIAHKINSSFLTVKGAQRQKVKIATKLFSHTISRAISRMGSLGLYKECDNWMECSRFFKLVNDWFDVFNSKIPVSDSRNRLKAYGLALTEQNEILNNMELTVNSLKVIGSKTKLPFQKGIIVSIRSLKLLFQELKQEFDIKYLLTYNLNQDPLEGFFSIMRSIGGLYDHPTALQFKYRMRNYVLGRNDEVISNSCNVMQGNDAENIAVQNFSSIENICNLSGVGEDDAKIVTKELFKNFDLQNTDEVDATDNYVTDDFSELKWDGLENLAGFVAFKLRKNECLGSISSKLNDVSSTWINHLSEGGLMKPTDEFLSRCRQLNDIFETINGKSLKITPNFIKQHIDCAKDINVSNDVKRLFFLCKMYFRIRILNNSIKELSNIRKRKITKTTT